MTQAADYCSARLLCRFSRTCLAKTLHCICECCFQVASSCRYGTPTPGRHDVLQCDTSGRTPGTSEAVTGIILTKHNTLKQAPAAPYLASLGDGAARPASKSRQRQMATNPAAAQVTTLRGTTLLAVHHIATLCNNL